MSKYIRKLIAEGEHQHLDFKFEISDARKIARTFSAFANTEGGKLLVGVKDNGNITGIRTDEEAYMIESAADLYSKPRVAYSLKTWEIDGKTILEVDIPASKLRPHLAPWKDDKWRAFVRVADENFLANSIQVEVWKKDRASSKVEMPLCASKLAMFLSTFNASARCCTTASSPCSFNTQRLFIEEV